MKFCCVTPCYNSEKHIDYTMRSVLTQSVFQDRSNQLCYIIKDGDSDDKTIQTVKAIAQEYKGIPNISIEVISKKDNGLYDALAESFQKLPRGDIYSYINAGDYYSPFAFEIVSDIFTTHGIRFLTGLNCVYNDRNHLLSCHLPYKYNKSLLTTGCYGTILPHIQQESTFWEHSLHQKIDLDHLKKIRLAGDFLMWKTFIEYEKLYIVSAQLAGFKIHKGQLTGKLQSQYQKELKQLSESLTLRTFLIAWVYKVFWHFPNMLKILFSKQIFRYSHNRQEYILSCHPRKKHL